MRIVLILTLQLLAGCCLQPGGDAPVASLAEAAPASAEPQEMPTIEWSSTGRKLYAYHHVWGDCEFLSHGNGRNAAWGRWRLPLEEVTADDIVSDGHQGFEVRYTCRDGSACIQSGKLEETPGRITEQTIPFETRARAQEWLDDVQKLRQACAAYR